MEKLKRRVKDISFVSALLGLYHLGVFCIYEGISLPLQLSVLPSLLIALGLISFLILVVLIVYSTLFGAVVLDPFKIGYTKLFYNRPCAAMPETLSAVVNFLIYFCFTPSLLVLLSYNDYPFISEMILIFTFAIPFLYAWYASSSGRSVFTEGLKSLFSIKFLKLCGTYFFIQFVGMLSLTVAIVFVQFGLKTKSDPAMFITYIVFLVLGFVMLIPPASSLKLKLVNNEITTRSINERIMSVPAFYVYLIIGVFACIPPVTRSTAETALKFLNMGGGMERSYSFSPKADVPIPPEAVEYCSENFCRTRQVHVSLDLGELLYIKTDYLGYKGTVFSLPTDQLKVIKLGQKDQAKTDEKGNAASIPRTGEL